MTYALRCTPNFYAGDIHGRDRIHLVRDMYDGDMIAVATKAEAELLVDMLTDPGDGPYLLADNQYGPPEYEVAASSEPAITLAQAMQALGLAEDFALDGSRLPVPSGY